MSAVNARRVRRPLLVAAVVLVTLNMRAAILSVPPVLGSIRHDLHLAATAQGLLVSLPIICFGVSAFAGPRIIRRLGMEATLVAAMFFLAAGITLRLALSVALLFVGTAVIGMTIGVSNVVIPALIKRDFPDHIGLMTGVYITSMLGTGALASGGTVPLMNATGIGWRWALAVWAAPAIVAALVWTLLLRPSESTVSPVPVEAVGGLWRDRVAWQVTALMGLQSLTFYSLATWLPTLLTDSGVKRTSAGLLLAVMSVTAIPSSLGAATLAGHRWRPKLSVGLAVGMSAVGLLGFLLAPATGAVAWTVLFGLGQGGSLGLALTFIGLRSPDSRHAAQLSGMAQSVGYLLAAVGPLVLGDVHDIAGGWTLPLVLVAAITVPQLLFGIGAGRSRYVGA